MGTIFLSGVPDDRDQFLEMSVKAAATTKTYSRAGQWEYCAYTCISVCVWVCASVDGVGDISGCLCTDLRLCGWVHSDMSQATSRPHESVSLGGGILMWKWEQ